MRWERRLTQIDPARRRGESAIRRCETASKFPAGVGVAPDHTSNVQCASRFSCGVDEYFIAEWWSIVR
jgi:hypothetical protein